MKKIVLSCIMLSLLMVSCKEVPKNEDSVVISKEEYQQLKQSKVAEYPKPFELVGYDDTGADAGIIMGSDGHEYLITRYGYNDETQSHYIDCKICLSRQQHLEDLLMEVIKNTSKDSIK